jgi:hypothetical protein
MTCFIENKVWNDLWSKGEIKYHNSYKHSIM